MTTEHRKAFARACNRPALESLLIQDWRTGLPGLIAGSAFPLYHRQPEQPRGIAAILQVVSDITGVSEAMIRGPRKLRPAVFARHVAFRAILVTLPDTTVHEMRAFWGWASEDTLRNGRGRDTYKPRSAREKELFAAICRRLGVEL